MVDAHLLSLDEARESHPRGCAAAARRDAAAGRVARTRACRGHHRAADAATLGQQRHGRLRRAQRGRRRRLRRRHRSRCAWSARSPPDTSPRPSVEPGTAVRVLTGAIMPPGADAVVKVEDTDAAEGVAALPGERRGPSRRAQPGRHVRRAGSDMQQGDLLLPAGTRIGPAAVAVLAAAGHARVDVHRQAACRHRRHRRRADARSASHWVRPRSPTATASRSPPRSSPPVPNRSAWASPRTTATRSASGSSRASSPPTCSWSQRRRLGRGP